MTFLIGQYFQVVYLVEIEIERTHEGSLLDKIRSGGVRFRNQGSAQARTDPFGGADQGNGIRTQLCRRDGTPGAL